jgi:hypothetical protein
MPSQLGDYQGRRLFLKIRVSPTFNEIEDVGVGLYLDPRTDATIQIARIDTSHGFVHFDRLYRRDQPKEPIDVDVWEAAERLEANWRRYARSHDRAHET